jgi:hypothetical protein
VIFIGSGGILSFQTLRRTGKMTDKKIALLTRTGRRIRKEIAGQPGTLGITVVIGARDEKKGEEAETLGWCP